MRKTLGFWPFIWLLIISLMIAGISVNRAWTEEAAKENPMQEIAENVYFQIMEYSDDYASLHFRGKLLGFKLIRDITIAIYEIEGMVSVSPTPYKIAIQKSPIYTWEEILSDAKQIIQNTLNEYQKSLTNNPDPNSGL